MMKLRSLIGKLQSPSFQTVVAIAQHAGPGMAVERLKSIRFPVGTVQVWELIPKLPPLDREPCVMTVLIRQHRLASWAPKNHLCGLFVFYCYGDKEIFVWHIIGKPVRIVVRWAFYCLDARTGH